MSLNADFFTSWVAGAQTAQGYVDYVSLHTGSPATVANELDASALGYARARISYAFLDAVQDRLRTTTVVDFPRANNAWGTIRALGLAAGATVGSALNGSVALASGLVVTTGTVIRVPIGSGFDVNPGANMTSAGMRRLLVSAAPRQFFGGAYFGLHTGAPTVANELSGAGYARRQAGFMGTASASGRTLTWTWNVSSGNVRTQLGFGTLTNPSFATPTHWALWDRSTGGTGDNILLWGTLASGVPAPPSSGYYHFPASGSLALTIPVPAQ